MWRWLRGMLMGRKDETPVQPRNGESDKKLRDEEYYTKLLKWEYEAIKRSK